MEKSIFDFFANLYNMDKYAGGITDAEKEEAIRTFPDIEGIEYEIIFPHQVPQTGRWIAHDKAWVYLGEAFSFESYTFIWEKSFPFGRMKWNLYKWVFGKGMKKVSLSALGGNG